VNEDTVSWFVRLSLCRTLVQEEAAVHTACDVISRLARASNLRQDTDRWYKGPGLIVCS
jgi:hypothetical protein